MVELLPVVLCCVEKLSVLLHLAILVSDHIFQPISAKINSQGFVSHFLK